MKSRNYMWLWVGAVFFCFGVLGELQARAADGREVIGFYDVIEAPDLNAREVQVTLRIRLVNQTEGSLTITQLELQSLPPTPKTTGTTSSATTDLFLTAHDSRTIERQFTVSRAEYEHWQKGGRPRFLLTIETSGSERLSRVLLLFPMKGIRE